MPAFLDTFHVFWGYTLLFAVRKPAQPFSSCVASLVHPVFFLCSDILTSILHIPASSVNTNLLIFVASLSFMSYNAIAYSDMYLIISCDVLF